MSDMRGIKAVPNAQSGMVEIHVEGESEPILRMSPSVAERFAGKMIEAARNAAPAAKEKA